MSYIGSTPEITLVTPGTNQLTVDFIQSDVGDPVPTYYYSLDGTTLLGTGVSASPLIITGISGETTFYIAASNSAGDIVSDASSGTPNYVGSAPTITAVTPGTNQLTVDFVQDTSGNPAATYYYSLDGTTLLGTGVSASPLIITGISGETTFYIAASNSAGDVVSDASAGTPNYLGSAPTITAVTPGTNQLTVDFAQDASGNPAATYYYSLDGTTLLGTGVSASPLIITGISGETTFYIAASNSAGDVVSDASSGTPNYVGSAPTITAVTPGLNQLTVGFTQSSVGNPSPTYYYSLNGTSLLGDGTSSSPLVISGLSGEVTFYIIASNAAGNVVSDASSGMPQLPNIPVPCFGENTRILCFNPDKYEEEYMLIRNIRQGTLVKTARNGYVKVDMIGKTKMQNNYMANERHKNRLYKCTKRNYPEMMNDDLILTGCHCILVDEFKNNEEREKTIEVNNGRVYITDNKYRLPACVDKRAQIYEKSGTFTIYHFALEHDDYYMNYGVYANGLLVETSSKRYMRELSNMELL